MKKCILLFSGGKDSFLSAVYLIEQGYKVYLVHYNNGSTIGLKNIKLGFNRLKKKYGEEKVEYIGSKNICFFIRNLIKKYYNLYIDEIASKYGDVTISQLNCLTCRCSMYVTTIILCKQMGINYVADGARISQLFAIEQDEMLKIFTDLFKKYNINLLFPVKDLKDDYDEKNEFIIRGIIPKVTESQCLIGTPLLSSNVDITSLNSCINIYNNLFEEAINEMIDKYKNIKLEDDFI